MMNVCVYNDRLLLENPKEKIYENNKIKDNLGVDFIACLQVN